MALTFDYAPIVIPAADDGEPLLLFRPEIMVTIYGPAGATVIHALADTGADYTVLSAKIASNFGIPTWPATGPPFRAFGGQEIASRFSDVELQMGSGSDTFRWQSRVFFTDDPSVEDTPVIGHVGFFEFFTMTFRGGDNILELEPNEHLPRID